MSILTKHMDEHPYTGVREVTGYLKLIDNRKTREYIESNKLTALTPGNTYEVVKVEGFWDCEDVTILDDRDTQVTLGDEFFEEIITDVTHEKIVRLKGIKPTDIVFWDIDGVLARFDFPKYNKKVFNFKDWIRMNIAHDMYEHVETTQCH